MFWVSSLVVWKSIDEDDEMSLDILVGVPHLLREQIM